MKKYIIIGIFLTITIIGSVSVVMYFNYQNEVLVQDNKKEQLKSEQEFKEEQELSKQRKLQTSLDNAKTNRTALWNANADKNGKVTNEIAKWIEDRYNQEVQTAIERYK